MPTTTLVELLASVDSADQWHALRAYLAEHARARYCAGYGVLPIDYAPRGLSPAGAAALQAVAL